ncbi:hypothetical protein [Victivallis vadensis]|uniref:hypothetical protein n=1 Tax=Victivallis vadensis TaxID=172901 RepID=UPI0023F79EF9|nr:hypothetical protein [Victivallis vadensis]
MSKITTEIVADDSQVERTLKKVENQAKKTGKAVDRATGGRGGSGGSVPRRAVEAPDQLEKGLRAGGLEGISGRVGDFADLGAGKLALAAGAIGVVIQGVTTALEYMRQEVANTAEMLANNVKELQQTFNDQKARHKTELDALKQLRELNNAGDSPARTILQKQALETLTRTHKGLPTGLDENGNITNLDEAERIVMEKQNRELQDNLARQAQEIDKQIKLWNEVIDNPFSTKTDVANAGQKIQELANQRDSVAKQRNELRQFDYDDFKRQRDAERQLKSDQFYENEIKLQKQQLHLQSLKNKGLDEEYARQKAIYDIQNRGLEVNEEAIRRQLALQRANADERFKGDQNKRAEDLKFQAEQKLRTPEQQAIAAALRAAEAAKKAAGGSSLTKPEREREEQIAKLNYKLNNLPRLNLGDMSTRTNALTARGGFASGIVRPQADQVNYQIMTNSKRQVALLEQILKETKNGFRI